MVGVVVIAGTGSIAYGVNAGGESARAGGWGFLLEDQGSAYEIGRQALIAVAREWDGLGPKTRLTPFVLKHLGITNASHIPQVIYQDPAPKLKIAGISPVVSRAAQAGDPIAQNLFFRAGQALGEMASEVIRKLGFRDLPILVSGVGGVFEAGQLIWKPYGETVLLHWPEAKLMAPTFPPLVGALLLAYKSCGVPLSAERLNLLMGFQIVDRSLKSRSMEPNSGQSV
jgi:N-acetylglucosamine kinase-like BadF-type ATPase